MKNKPNVSKVMSGFVWKTMEQYLVISLQFVLQIVLARLIIPEEYGIIAIVSIFISLSTVLVQKGFALALVQKKDCDELDYSSVISASILIAGFLYIVLFLSSPLIASFFKYEQLRGLVRVMGIGIFPGAVVSVQNAKIKNELIFKFNFFASVVAVSISGGVGIICAVNGFGVWALVWQQLSLQFVQMLVLLFVLKWFPGLKISFIRLQVLFKFGWKVLITGLVDEVFVEIRSVLIGKYYNSAILSFYNRGQQFPRLFMKSINGSLQSVLLPVLSKQQDNITTVKNILRKTIRTSAYFLLPLLTGLALTAPSFVPLILTDKWTPCVIYLQIFCIYYAVWPLNTSVEQTLYSLGKSDVVMKVEIVRKIIDLCVLLFTINLGVLAIAVGAMAVSLASVIVYSVFACRQLNYRIYEQLSDIIPNLIMSVIMGGAVFMVQLIFRKVNYFTLVIQVFVGITVYLIESIMTKNETLKDTINRLHKAR